MSLEDLARQLAPESDPDPTVAAASAAALEAISTALAGLPERAALDALFLVLDRAEPRVWKRLFDGAVSEARFPTEALLVALDEDDDRNRRWVRAHALAHRGVARGYQVLLDDYPSARLLDDIIARGVEPVRSVCALVYGEDPLAENELAGRLGQRRNKTEGIVHQLVRDPTSKAAGIAVLVLGFWDDPRSVDALLQVACDPAYARSVRDDALESLGQLEAPEAVEVLCGALGDSTVDGFVKRNCAIALGYIGDREALPTLASIVAASADRELVIAATQAIEEIEEIEAS